MGIGNSKSSVDPVIKGSGSNNQINLGDSVLKHANHTAVQNVMNTVGETASRIIVSGGDIATAPGTWVKDIQKNWHSYVVSSAVILLFLGFFYCSCRFYFNRKSKNASTNSLIQLAAIINGKSDIAQQRQLPSNITTE